MRPLFQWLAEPERACKIVHTVDGVSLSVAWKEDGGEWIYACATGADLDRAINNLLADPFAQEVPE